MFVKQLFKMQKSCWNGGFPKSHGLVKARDERGSESQTRSSEVARHQTLQSGGWGPESCLSFSSRPSAMKKFSTLEESLEASDLQPQTTAHYGIPTTACTMAFDPGQHLLALATKDGRIKIFQDAGIEILLQSSTRAPLRFLQFFNNQNYVVSITKKNDIEIWDLSTQMVCTCLKWEVEITAFTILHGSPFMFVGDETGMVKVLQFDLEKPQVCILSYFISPHLTLGEIVKSCYTPSVISIVPQPSSEYERLLISYKNGLSILWGLAESKVLALWGGTNFQQKVLFGKSRKLEEVENTSLQSLIVESVDDKELQCVCWTCHSGCSFAAGYTDGDIWLWSVPSVSKLKIWLQNDESKGSYYSDSPMLKIHLGSGTTRLPIFMLKWWGCDEIQHGRSGYLSALVGGDLGGSKVLKVTSLKDADASNSKHFVELPLIEPLADLVVVSNSGGSLSNLKSSLLTLTSRGNLYAYDTAEISNLFYNSKGGNLMSPPAPIRIQLSITESNVTAAKLILMHDTDGIVNDLFQAPWVLKSGFSLDFLSDGKKPPIRMNKNSTWENSKSKGRYIYMTGHQNGSVNIWDVSTPNVYSVCNLELGRKMESTAKGPSSDVSPVTALDFCPLSGFLAIGNEKGLIRLYRLGNELFEVNNGRSTKKDENSQSTAAFRLITHLHAHEAAVCCMVIASAQDRLAVGCESGRVSLINLKTHSLIYHGKSFPGNVSRIISLSFALIPLCTAFSVSSFPATPFLKRKQSGLTTVQAMVLFVTTKDAGVIALDGNSGDCISSVPLKPKHQSSAISLHLLDASGASVLGARNFRMQNQDVDYSFSSQESESTISSRGVMQNIGLGPVECPRKRTPADTHKKLPHSVMTKNEGNMVSMSGTGSTQLLLLLCSEDSLRMYSMCSVLQGRRNRLLKAKLHMPCAWSSIFKTQSNRPGLILLYKGGEVEFRSLPDLLVLKETSLRACLKCQIEPDMSMLRTISCTITGQIGLVNFKKELHLLSVLDDKHELRTHASLPPPCEKDGIEGTDKVLLNGRQANRKKAFLGGMFKELKVGVRKNTPGVDDSVTVPKIVELARLFGATGFSAMNSFQAREEPVFDSLTSHETRENDIDIDDIHLEDEGIHEKPSYGKSSHGSSLMKKVKRSFTGKKIPKHDTSKNGVIDNEFIGGHVRTLSEIKASYGKDREISGMAAHARDKLLQQNEKLQAINKKTFEMQEGAEDFQMLAVELVKALEAKNKWGF